MSLVRTLPLGTLILTILAAHAAGCGDDAAETTTTTTTNAASTTGAGGAGGSSTDTSTASGAGGSTGEGGGNTACLEASAYADAFELKLAELCVVERHAAPFVVGFDENYVEIAPTWGRHQGPLTLAQTGNAFTLTRWKAPAEPSAPLTVESTAGPVDTAIPMNAAPATLFLNAAAVDLPFGNFTAVGWADFGTPKGELLLVGANGIEKRHAVSSLYAVAGLTDKAKHRVLTSSASTLGATGSAIGLHATDLCDGAICPSGTALITKQGDASGPVVTDSAGHALAVFPDIAKGTQSLVGYGAGAVAPGVTPAAGATLATLDGSGTSLVALAPTNEAAGIALFQPAVMFVPGDVLVQQYTVLDAKTLNAKGAAKAALVPKTPGTDVRMMRDDQDRIWVGLRIDTTKPESVFFVLARR
ncbi:MAG: hypothetical protein FJ096_01795 [Deltaproteobacteria bacterium]|nr:hypothetical protein [Deltaproteobacteria bacterium]